MANGYLFQWMACWAGMLCLCSTDAHAQRRPVAAQPECAPPGGSAPPQSRTEEVAALYNRFECHFARREYVACLPFLEQACKLTDSPRCLLNLGAVHHALMHCQLARAYYQQYLDRSPYDEEVTEARNALEELNAACPPSAPRAAEWEPPAEPVGPIAMGPVASGRVASGPVAATPSALKPGVKNRGVKNLAGARPHAPLLAWTLLGAGVAGLTASVFAAGYGARAERDFEARDRENGPLGRSNDPELRAIDRRGRDYNQLAGAFGVLSGVLIGAGATLWLVDVSPGSSLEVSADGAASVRYELSF